MKKDHAYQDLLAEDTIAAIATAPGVAAIGIVRLSGPEARSIQQACFRNREGRTPAGEHRRMMHGYWVDPQTDEAVDEVMTVFMEAPHTYTGEDVVEIHGHGGSLVLSRILAMAVAAGARPARAGEFTLRAFRNGRLDLLQAESVVDLIDAQTESARRLALKGLRGGLSDKILAMKSQVMELLAHLETHLEFPMEDVVPMQKEEWFEQISQLRQEVEALQAMAQRSDIYRRGLFTVITGRPNVGKSQLFNRLLGRERALVTLHPGTTRDTLEERFFLGGLELMLVDTAGGRQVVEEVELLGIERTTDAARRADLIWFLIDATEGIVQQDREWLGKLLENTHPQIAPFFLLVNKIDLKQKPLEALPPRFMDVFPRDRIFEVSAKNGEGIESFLEKVKEVCLNERKFSIESDLLINQRHLQVLKSILDCFGHLDDAIRTGLTLDCVALDLWTIKNKLDELDGTRTPEDLLGEIFSRFCIGK